MSKIKIDELPADIREQIVRTYADDHHLRQVAFIEACMTFMKERHDEASAKYVFIDKNTAQSKEEYFHFGRIFEETLAGLESGSIARPAEIEGTYAAARAADESQNRE